MLKTLSECKSVEENSFEICYNSLNVYNKIDFTSTNKEFSTCEQTIKELVYYNDKIKNSIKKKKSINKVINNTYNKYLYKEDIIHEKNEDDLIEYNCTNIIKSYKKLKTKDKVYSIKKIDCANINQIFERNNKPYLNIEKLSLDNSFFKNLKALRISVSKNTGELKESFNRFKKCFM